MPALDLAGVFARAQRGDVAPAALTYSEMVVTAVGPLTVAFPNTPSTTYPCKYVGTAPTVGARVLVVHGGAAAHYCLGVIN